MASLTALLLLNTAAVATTVAMLAGTTAAWYKGWRTRAGRIAYSVVTLAALSYLLVAVTYNMIGTPLPRRLSDQGQRCANIHRPPCGACRRPVESRP